MLDTTQLQTSSCSVAETEAVDVVNTCMRRPLHACSIRTNACLLKSGYKEKRKCFGGLDGVGPGKLREVRYSTNAEVNAYTL